MLHYQSPYPDEFWSFIENNLHADTKALMLKYGGKPLGFPVDFAITQIEARRKAAAKMSHLCSNPMFLFPSALLAEQCTSELLASFHADIIRKTSDSVPELLVDLTCGLCVDSFSFCEVVKRVVGVDILPITAEIANINATTLDIANFKAECGDGMEVLPSIIKRCGIEKADWIYIDPARRKASAARAYGFSDCSPDVVANIGLLRSYSHKVLIKASPMLDISQTIRDLENVSRIWIVAMKGECKEVLVELDFNSAVNDESVNDEVINGEVGNGVEVTAVDPVCKTKFIVNDYLHTDNSVDYVTDINGLEGMILCEPDAAVMKTGAWGELCRQWSGLRKLHGNTNLFVAENPPSHISDAALPFPGRMLRIESVWQTAKDAAKALRGLKANVATRNYPINADVLRKKLNVKESSDAATFVYATTAVGGKRLILKCVNLKQA
jgi:hypothetical protein